VAHSLHAWRIASPTHGRIVICFNMGSMGHMAYICMICMHIYIYISIHGVYIYIYIKMGWHIWDGISVAFLGQNKFVVCVY
jgi:hypothetical protein